MKETAEYLPRGQALCVGCDAKIDLSAQLNSIQVQAGNDVFYLIYCNRCGPSLNAGGQRAYKEVGRAAFEKLGSSGGHARDYAVLMETVLLQHDFDPVKAFEIGSALPQHIHTAITQGRADLTKIGEIILVSSEEALP